MRSRTSTILAFVVLSLNFSMLAQSPGSPSLKQKTRTSEPSRPAPKASDIYKRTLPSVMTLVVTKVDGSKGLGTGFMAVKDGLAITAWHVVENAAQVSARFSNGEEFEVSGLVDRDSKRDLALIKVKVSAKPLLALVTDEPVVGAKAYVIGAPKGLEFSVSDGLISQLRIFDGSQEFQFTCPASPGNSGGPLLDEKGKVLGVVSWQNREGQNLNFAIPARFASGLDASLPTTPWNQVQPIKRANSEPANKFIDDQIRNAWAVIYDTVTLENIVAITIIRAPGGYKNNFPSSYYQILEQLKMNKVFFDTMKADDLLHIKAIVYFQFWIGQKIEGLESLKRSVNLAYRTNGWSHEANEELSKTYAFLNSNPPMESPLRDLQNNSDFINSSPKKFKDFLSASDNPKLGVLTWSGNTLQIACVNENCIANQMDLRAGDIIESVLSNGFKKVTSMKEFKDALLGTPGEDTIIYLKRDGKDVANYWKRDPAFAKK